MSDEAAFLTALKVNFADDTTRLIYADWLDEHEEPAKAEYLRRVVALAQSEGNLATVAEAAPLLKLAERLPEEWRTGAGARFALVLSGHTDKVHAIIWLRETTGDGLAEAKEASEHLPHPVLACVPYEFAVRARARIRRPDVVNTFIAPSVSGPLPAGATYDLIVRCNTRTTQPETSRAARAALTKLLAAQDVSETEAEQHAALERDIVLASGLTLQETRTRRVSLNELMSQFSDPNGRWWMLIYRRICPTPLNPE